MEKIAFLNDSAIIAALITSGFALLGGVIALYISYRSKVKWDKDLENHRSWLEERNKEIQSQLDTKLELLRIEYGTVFTKRLEVIEEIYVNLLQVQELYTKLYSHDKGKKMDEESVKRLKKTSDNFKHFLDYFERKKIYLSEDLANTINGFLMLVFVKLYEKYPDEINENLNVSESASREFKKLVNMAEKLKPTKILNALENEFRTLIGVEITSKNTSS